MNYTLYGSRPSMKKADKLIQTSSNTFAEEAPTKVLNYLKRARATKSAVFGYLAN